MSQYNHAVRLQDNEFFSCPACRAHGWNWQPVCCGATEDKGSCCGNPDARQVECQWCAGLGQTSSALILDYARSVGDMEIYAEHEANQALADLLPGHPARKRLSL